MKESEVIFSPLVKLQSRSLMRKEVEFPFGVIDSATAFRASPSGV